MKKTLYGLVAMCVMMLFACCTSEPKLEGTWEADGKALLGEDAKEFEKVDLVMTLDGQNMTMAFDMLANIKEDKTSMEIGIKADAKGAYTRTDDKVKAELQGNSVDIYKFNMELDDETKKMMEAVGMTEEKFKESFKEEMKTEDLKKSLSDISGEMTIKELTETTLVLVDTKNAEMKFTRKVEK